MASDAVGRAPTEFIAWLQALAATVFRDRAEEGRKGRGWGDERRCLPVSFVVQMALRITRNLRMHR